MSVVTFRDYLPIPRYDSTPWTGVEIEESGDPAGPYNLIDTITFTDPDPNPGDPKIRSFTTDNAVLEVGWYIVTFIDVLGNRLPTEPLKNPPDELSSWAPSVQMVARHIMSRTKDEFGVIKGTFTTSTTPTDAQVDAIIDDAVRAVQDMIGEHEIPVIVWDNASRVTAIRAAMQVELDFYSDQVNTGRSIYPQLKELFELEMEKLQGAILAAELEEGDTSAFTGGPKYTFPDTSPIGLRTNF